MYEVFDAFFKNETWSGRHQRQMDEFFPILETVIMKDNFSADRLGEHVHELLGIDESSPLSNAIDKYVTDAQAVRGYLVAILLSGDLRER